MKKSENGFVKHAIDSVRKNNSNFLDFYRLNLTEIPSSLYSLGNLKSLDLGFNKIDYIPDDISKLANLEILRISNNSLKKLPEGICNLKKLKALDISSNEITMLPENFGNLSNLETLHANANLLTNLPKSFEKLKNLKSLSLIENRFATFPDQLYSLSNIGVIKINLQKVNRDFLFSLDERLCQLENLFELVIDSQNCLVPPPEIVSRGVKNMKHYFLQIEAEGQDYLYEAKLILIGEPGAGKTSLARKIVDINSPLPTEEETTRGIDIHKYKFNAKYGNEFTMNIWDFGGQEIYHSTHQFFLTKRSLYILVADTRKEDTSYNYWLSIVELLSDSSPIFIVHNEKGDRSREINIGSIIQRFSNLKGNIYQINLATNRGIDYLINSVVNEIQTLPHVGDKLPKTWVRVRKEIEKKSKKLDFISEEEYFSICYFNGITDRQIAEQLSNYLHDIGVFLHFKDGSILQKTVFLNNVWVTEAVYKVLDDEKIKQILKGLISKEDANNIWSEGNFLEKKNELLELMLKFELLFQLERSKEYIIPQLLPINQPYFNWDYSKTLNLRYLYEFMPKGIISQLIVRLHKYIKPDNINKLPLVWREGVLLERGKETALIIEMYDSKEISISVKGDNPKIFLTLISEELERINLSYPKIQYSKLVPCNCSICKENSKINYYEFSDLERRIRNDKKTVECKYSYEKVFVNSLVDQISGSKGIDSIHSISKIHNFPKRDKVFISYCRADSKWLDEAKRHFKPFINNVDFWDDTKIRIGQKWHDEILESIKASKIAILLVSPDFLASDYINEIELTEILSREKDISIFIVLISFSVLNEARKDLTTFNFANVPSKPLASLTPVARDKIWANLTKEILELMK